MIQQLRELTSLAIKVSVDGTKLEIVLEEIPDSLAAMRPRRLWIDNPRNVYCDEIEALHDTLWQRGLKAELKVTSMEMQVPPVGAGNLKVIYPPGWKDRLMSK